MNKVYMLGLIAVFLFGCEPAREARHYKVNSDGVRYFRTCIDGFKFIGTHSGPVTNLSGPVGDCRVSKTALDKRG